MRSSRVSSPRPTAARPRAMAPKLMLSTLALAALAALGASGCAASRPKFDYDAERKATSRYAIGAGDVLQVRAWKNEALSQRVTVRPDGYVTLPLIGDIMASGRSVDAVSKDVATQAAKFYTETPVVAVEVAELHSYRIYVLGEVTRPGEFSPRGPVTVLQALALAGGFTRFAAPDAMTIVRHNAQGERRIPFVYAQVVEQGDMRENLTLQPNDVVVVP
jgi:polysaccharide biosynthesis/export protein